MSDTIRCETRDPREEIGRHDHDMSLQALSERRNRDPYQYCSTCGERFPSHHRICAKCSPNAWADMDAMELERLEVREEDDGVDELPVHHHCLS